MPGHSQGPQGPQGPRLCPTTGVLFQEPVATHATHATHAQQGGEGGEAPETAHRRITAASRNLFECFLMFSGLNYLKLLEKTRTQICISWLAEVSPISQFPESILWLILSLCSLWSLFLNILSILNSSHPIQHHFAIRNSQVFFHHQ